MSDYVTKTNVLSALARFKENTDALYETKADANDMKSEINQHEARLQNLEQKAGDYSIVQYRGTNAVPTGKASYGLVEKIVGKTRAWNQLVDTDTSSVTLISGHKYLTVINGSFSIVTGAGTAISVTGGTDCVYDLTLIFGSGNEPSTVEDAIAQLPALGQYNAYDDGSLVSTEVSGVESRDTSDNLLDTLSLSETVTLKGIDATYYDELIVETGKKTKRIGRCVLDGTNVTAVWTNGIESAQFLANSLPDGAAIYQSGYAGNVISDKYGISTNLLLYGERNIPRFKLVDSSLSAYMGSTDALNTYLQSHPIVVQYPLATPTTESIDPIIDNFIEVQGGGTVETIQTQTPVIDNCLDVGYLAL